MIFYIHGFNSSASNNQDKFDELVNIFEDTRVVMLEYDSGRTATEIIEKLTKEAKGDLRNSNDFPDIFIGTSLGAFFADILAEKFEGYAALFNPCHAPSRLLAQFVGENTNFGTGVTYTFTRQALDSYREHERRYRSPKCVFVAQDDELLNPLEVADYYEHHARIISMDGGHRVPSFLPHASLLVEFSNTIIIDGLND